MTDKELRKALDERSDYCYKELKFCHLDRRYVALMNERQVRTGVCINKKLRDRTIAYKAKRKGVKKR